MEALPLHSCHNLPRTLMDARDLKGWAVLGAAAGGGSEPVGRVAVTGPTILVLGESLVSCLRHLEPVHRVTVRVQDVWPHASIVNRFVTRSIWRAQDARLTVRFQLSLYMRVANANRFPSHTHARPRARVHAAAAPTRRQRGLWSAHQHAPRL